MEVVEYRMELVVIECFKCLGEFYDLEKVDVISLDMWEVFKNVVIKFLFNVDWVYDCFYIS